MATQLRLALDQRRLLLCRADRQSWVTPRTAQGGSAARPSLAADGTVVMRGTAASTAFGGTAIVHGDTAVVHGDTAVVHGTAPGRPSPLDTVRCRVLVDGHCPGTVWQQCCHQYCHQ